MKSVKSMNTYDALLAASGLLGGNGGSGPAPGPTPGGADLSTLEIYVADFVSEPPTVTDGALDGYHRVIVA